MTIRITSVLLLMIISVATPQDWQWQRNDELLNPSGIKTKGMNTPFTGDFDEDGDIDLIVGCKGGVVQYYENIGTPDSAIWQMDEDYFSTLDLDTTFAPQPSLVDLDGDGVDELFLTYTYPYGEPTGLTHLYVNTGTSESPIWEFEEFSFDYENPHYSNHQFIDYDFDGDLDLLIASLPFAYERLYYFENCGDQFDYNFQVEPSIFNTLIPQLFGPEIRYRFDDVYGDSLLEILVISDEFDGDGSHIEIYVNEGELDFPDWQERSGWFIRASGLTSITLDDIDNDSDLDVILGNHHIPLYYKENLGSADSIEVDDLYNGKMLGPFFIDMGENICFVDYDNDDDFDFTYFFNWRTYPTYMYDYGSAVNVGNSYEPVYDFAQGFALPFGPIYFWSNVFLSAGDLNGDGFPELTTHMPAGSYFLNDNGTGYNTLDTLELDDPEYCMYPELADFDNDGLTDLIIRHSDSLWWRIYKNVGTPEEPAWLWMPDWLSGADRSMGIFRAANINRDDKIDLVGVGHHMYLHGFINTGSGDDVAFEYDPWIFAGWETNRISFYDCVDLDGDGDDDVIVDSSGVINFIENMTPVDIAETDRNLPKGFALMQNYPNPFNGSTKISFILDKPGKVNLTIYDILGREVTGIVNGNADSGKHTVVWDGKNSAGRMAPSGVYFIKLNTDGESIARKMIYLK
ncbi:MAG: T9SS type A sorting domain-containing protein [candidate division Zixibacteria bacterium]|nr:T9SS type A sorting domain-containing protein [candidate division Zixibacteria bacterium]